MCTKLVLLAQYVQYVQFVQYTKNKVYNIVQIILYVLYNMHEIFCAILYEIFLTHCAYCTYCTYCVNRSNFVHIVHYCTKFCTGSNCRCGKGPWIVPPPSCMSRPLRLSCTLLPANLCLAGCHSFPVSCKATLLLPYLTSCGTSRSARSERDHRCIRCGWP